MRIASGPLLQCFLALQCISLQAVLWVAGVSFLPPPPPAVWTCRMYPYHHQQYGCAIGHGESFFNISSMDIPNESFSITSGMGIQSIPISTASDEDLQVEPLFTTRNMDIQNVFHSTTISMKM